MGILRSGAIGNYDTNEVSRETAMLDDQVLFPSRTIQSEKDNSDINVIVRRFGVTGQIPGNARVPSYGDYSGVGDFQTAMNVVRQAEEQFMLLPSGVRSRFGNSPQAFLEFASNPENAGDLVKMGLAVARPREDTPIQAADSPPPVKDKEKRDARDSTERAGKRGKAAGGSEGDSGFE